MKRTRQAHYTEFSYPRGLPVLVAVAHTTGRCLLWVLVVLSLLVSIGVVVDVGAHYGLSSGNIGLFLFLLVLLLVCSLVISLLVSVPLRLLAGLLKQVWVRRSIRSQFQLDQESGWLFREPVWQRPALVGFDLTQGKLLLDTQTSIRVFDLSQVEEVVCRPRLPLLRPDAQWRTVDLSNTDYDVAFVVCTPDQQRYEYRLKAGPASETLMQAFAVVSRVTWLNEQDVQKQA